MLVLVLLISQAATPAAPAVEPTPAPTARPTPALGRSGEPARPKTLSEHAAEMRAKGTPPRRVSFDDLRTVDAPPSPPEGNAPESDGKASAGDTGAAAAQAQKRMDRAVKRGLAVPERTSTSRRDNARREWDEAAETCRVTPGCVPHYRDDARYGGEKRLKTDQELIEDLRMTGFAEPHPLPK